MRNPFAKAQPEASASAEPTYVRFDPGAVETVFVAPKWLRDIGLTSWFAVGFAILLTALIGLLALTATIVIPVILAAVIAAVASPVVGWMQRIMPRGIATILFVLLLLVIAGLFAWAVMSGIVSQANESSNELKHASSNITNWLSEHGVDPKKAQSAQSNVEHSTTKSASTLLSGVANVIGGLSGIVFFLAMTFISLIFLLKDGPMIRRWAESHMGVPDEVGHIITGRLIGSLRGYFLGVTIIAIFNGLVVGIGAVALGVPLVATIVLVTFIGAYIPFLGAWAAGAFSVLIAFGAKDPHTAVVGMIIIQLLANGLLQQMVQPIAYGAALGIHPLAALIATIGGGCLFGAIGLILGAPLLSAAVRISTDLGNTRAKEAGGADPPSDSEPLPAL